MIGTKNPQILIARNEVEVMRSPSYQTYKLYFKAIRVRPGPGMTSVIYQVIPPRSDNRNTSPEHSEGTHNQTTEQYQDNQRLTSVDTTTSDTAALIAQN